MSQDPKPLEIPSEQEIDIARQVVERKAKLEAELEEVKAADEAHIEKRFPELVAANRIQIEKNEKGEEFYIIARQCATKADAVMLGERIDMLHLFDQVKSACFLNGMVDATDKFLIQLRGLAHAAKTRETKWLLRRALMIGDNMLANLKNAVDEVDFTKHVTQSEEKPVS